MGRLLLFNLKSWQKIFDPKFGIQAVREAALPGQMIHGQMSSSQLSPFYGCLHEISPGPKWIINCIVMKYILRG